jgi:hypothetical protein
MGRENLRSLITGTLSHRHRTVPTYACAYLCLCLLCLCLSHSFSGASEPTQNPRTHSCSHCALCAPRGRPFGRWDALRCGRWRMWRHPARPRRSSWLRFVRGRRTGDCASSTAPSRTRFHRTRSQRVRRWIRMRCDASGSSTAPSSADGTSDAPFSPTPPPFPFLPPSTLQAGGGPHLGRLGGPERPLPDDGGARRLRAPPAERNGRSLPLH